MNHNSLLIRNLKNSDLMGGKTDVIVHVRMGDMDMKTKVVQHVHAKIVMLVKFQVLTAYHVLHAHQVHLFKLVQRVKTVLMERFQLLTGSAV